LQYFFNGAVRKRRSQSGGFIQFGYFSGKGGGRGSSDADVRTFWFKKTTNF